MLTIRLSRVGKKNKPMYRLIISEKAKDPYGRVLEILGSYNPHNKELKVEGEKIKKWISKGAGMSPSVNNLLIEKGIIEGEKIKASKARTKKKQTETKEDTKPEEAPAEKTAEKEPENKPKTEEDLKEEAGETESVPNSEQEK